MITRIDSSSPAWPPQATCTVVTTPSRSSSTWRPRGSSASPTSALRSTVGSPTALPGLLGVHHHAVAQGHALVPAGRDARAAHDRTGDVERIRARHHHLFPTGGHEVAPYP